MKFASFLKIGVALIGLLTSISAVAAPNDNKDKTLLILNSYTEFAPWSREITSPINLFVANDKSVHAEMFNLNNILITDSTSYKLVEANLFEQYKDNPPQYVVIIGSLAFTMRKQIKENWGDIPILLVTRDLTLAPVQFYLSGYDQPVMENTFPSISELRPEYNFTAIYVPDFYTETVDMMMDLIPDMEEFVFFSDNDFSSRYLARDIRTYVYEKDPEISFSWVQASADNRDALQDYMVTRLPKTGLLMSTWLYDQIGPFGYPNLAMGDLSILKSSLNPVFSLRRSYMTYGTIGGVFVENHEVYQQIETVLSKMMKGEDMRNVRFFTNKKNMETVLDYPMLTEYHLPINKCPKDTDFIDKPLSFWEKYHWYLIGALIAILIVIFAFLRKNILQKHKIELLTRHQRFVENMPVPYSKAKVIYDDLGNVVNIKYTVSNEAFNQLIQENKDAGAHYVIFPSEFIAEKTKLLLETRKPVTFIYHFENNDKFYVFTLCLVGIEKRNKDRKNEFTNEIDIFANDITSRQHTQLELRAATQRLDMTLSVAKLIPWEWDMVRDVLIFDADSLFKQFGCMLDGSTKKPEDHEYVISVADYMKIMDQEDAKAINEARTNLLRGKIDEFKAEYRLYVPHNGKKVEEWIEVNGSVSGRTKDGGAKSVIGSMLIVTERKLQELDLIEAKEKASESDKMKSAFLANMSHEIRTPLNAIVGFSGLLCETTDPKSRKEYMEIISKNNDMLLTLINDVLDLAKIESNAIDISYSVVDVNRLLNTIGETIKLRLTKGVMLNLAAGESECYIWTDGNRLSQVLINLLTNAAKFTNKGSITFGYDIEGESLHFFVKDTGIGISVENQSRLFHRFDKLNNFMQGTGLGLSICKSLVEKMGGEIGMNSRGEGKGSTFWFDIPYRKVDESDLKEFQKQVNGNTDEVFEETLHKDHSAAETTIQSHTHEGGSTDDTEIEIVNGDDPTKPLILVAEDMDGNYLLLKNLISKRYRIIHAWDGQEAIAMKEKYKPNLILMDINMPYKNGFEATAEIRQTDPNIPIVAVTAYAYASDRKRILSSGFNDYVSKPVTREEINESIERNLATN